MRRAAVRRRDDGYEIPEGSVAELAVVAGTALGWNHQQITDAMNELAGHRPRTDLGNRLEARMRFLASVAAKAVALVLVIFASVFAPRGAAAPTASSHNIHYVN
jgi:ABC-type lipoprotein release transport system permease subunit